VLLVIISCCWLHHAIPATPITSRQVYPHIMVGFYIPIFVGSVPTFLLLRTTAPPRKDIFPICSYIGTNWTPGNRAGHIIELTSWKECSNVFYLFGGCYMGHPNMFVLNRDPLWPDVSSKNGISIYSCVPGTWNPRNPPYPHGAAAQDTLTSALVRSAPFAPLPLPSNASLGVSTGG
jgi:hypothetical protein